MKKSLTFILLIIVITGLTACVSFRKRTYAVLSGQGGQHDPVKISDNFYYVGTSDIAVYLLRTKDGFILFDTAYEHMHDMIVANIRAAGKTDSPPNEFDPNKIAIILSTQAHMDHAGGLEKMRLSTWAEVKAPKLAREELLSGSKNDFSPLIRMMPYTKVGLVSLLESQSLQGKYASLTWHSTPGHTKGCTSWSFEVFIQGTPRDVVIVCGFRRLPFTKLHDNDRYTNIKADYAITVKALQKLQENCDILLAPHMSDFKVKKTIQELKDGSYDFQEGRCQSELAAAIDEINQKILTAKN